MSEAIPLTDPHIQLGRRLAATEKKTREKALKAVEMYLKKTADLSEIDLLKLWKALYYCIWMQDRPVIQHELAQRLASMIHLVAEERAILFLRAFWQTMLREWNGIDKHRLDKFYALMRYFLNQSFQFVASHGWDKEILQAVMQVLKDLPLSPNPTVSKIGVQFHVLDVLADELNKVSENFIVSLGLHTLATIFEPVFHLAAFAEEKYIHNRIDSTVMEAITDAISTAAAEGGETQAKGEAAGQAIGDMIFNRASAEDTRSPNRGPLYDFRKSIMKAANRPTKRKRDDAEEAQTQPTVEPLAKKPNQSKAKATPVAASPSAAQNDEADSNSDIMDENSEDDEDYSAEADPYQASWEDHVIMDDSDDEDGEDDEADDEEPMFLPPSAKRRKLLLNVFVMKALQRMGTSPASDEDDEDDDYENGGDADEHFYMNDDAAREDESDESEEAPAPVATPAAPTPATPPAAQPKQPSSSGRRVVFDMSKVHVQEFDKHESPSTVQSPRPRTGTSARPILKASPSRSPMTNAASKNGEKNKMKSVQRKL